nr:unnamed protein product [Callosobruchus analis]
MALIHDNLWKFVEDPIPGTTEITAAEDTRRQQRALAKICLMVKACVYPYVREAKTAREAWENLETMYDDRGLTRRLTLMRHFAGINLADCKSMDTYVGIKFVVNCAGENYKPHIEKPTCNFDSSWLTLDASSATPSEALALELVLAEEFVDHVPSDVSFSFEDSDSILGIDEPVLSGVHFSRPVALEVQIKGMSSPTVFKDCQIRFFNKQTIIHAIFRIGK